MSTQLAETRPVDSVLAEEPARPTVTGFTGEIADNDRWLSAPRGVITAVLIATPFWMLVCAAIYRFT